MGPVRSRSPRGYSPVDTVLAILVVVGLCAFVVRWYASHDCQNLETEPLTMLPRIKQLAETRAKETGQPVNVIDCAFTARGMAGDCDKIGLTSSFATTYAYMVTTGPTGLRVTAVGQTPETFGSILVLTETGSIDRSASKCR